MRYIKIDSDNLVNGPGIRVVLWVSGCEHYCTGCHNKETWSHSAGEEFTDNTKKQLFDLLAKDHISGITISGGDPFNFKNAKDVLNLCSDIKKAFPDKNIWVYTGYLYEDLEYQYCLIDIDVIVDGKFVDVLKNNPPVKWRGSSNQRLIDVNASIESGKTVLVKEN